MNLQSPGLLAPVTWITKALRSKHDCVVSLEPLVLWGEQICIQVPVLPPTNLRQVQGLLWAFVSSSVETLMVTMFVFGVTVRLK